MDLPSKKLRLGTSVLSAQGKEKNLLYPAVYLEKFSFVQIEFIIIFYNNPKNFKKERCASEKTTHFMYVGVANDSDTGVVRCWLRQE